MLTHVEFCSDRFPPDAGEEAKLGSGIWGHRLAEFLRAELGKQGFELSEPLAEDWGWYLNVTRQPFAMSIGCGHYAEYPDGFLCFIEPHVPYIRKWFKKVDTQESVAALQRALDMVLSDAAGIRNKRWWTHDEFNNPERWES